MGQHHPDRPPEAAALTEDTSWCVAQGADLLLRLRVRPRASPEGIGRVRDGRLLVRVSAAPVDGAANERLMRILARELGTSLSMLILTRGVSSRDKEIVVRGAAARRPELLARFSARSS